jgi:hypothetical protein
LGWVWFGLVYFTRISFNFQPCYSPYVCILPSGFAASLTKMSQRAARISIATHLKRFQTEGKVLKFLWDWRENIKQSY